jgi:simple sugar transport system ATP-binding protein
MSLELRDIHKRFGPIRANDGVTLRVEAGTLHGLLGENGAGKSTLMKILSGYLRADAGDIVIDGTRIQMSSPGDAIRAGIGMLHQDPLVFLPLSVLDNLLLGSPSGRRVDRAAATRGLLEHAERFGFTFNPDAPARSLTVGERQQLEIVRLLWLGARVLILDEPTTGISATQREKLFEALRTLARQGMIVIFVSHKLEEVEELCGRVTVMRTGKVVGEAEMPCPTERLVELMFGQVLAQPERPAVEHADVVLELDSVVLKERSRPAGRPVSLTLRAGEIVGLAGLEGSGQRTLLRTCAGLLAPAAGRVRIGGRDVTGRGYRDRLAAGMHYLPAGRLEEGLVAGLTVTEHFVLTGDGKGFFVDWGRAREMAAKRIGENFIRGTPTSPADALSGGNQQRLLLAMMPPDTRLLLMEHPTRGLDIESADWVWTRLIDRLRRGTAIVFASADLDELLRYSDRILVFFAGEVLKILDARETTGEELGHLIGGKELV